MGSSAISFEMEVNAPYSLNYLIFMQNIYLNQFRESGNRPLFPYIDHSKWGIIGPSQFRESFRKVWYEEVRKSTEDWRFGHKKIFCSEKDYFPTLYETNKKGEDGFQESILAFSAWWDSIAGKIAIEKVFDDENMQKLYLELSSAARTTETHNRLKIDLIFDKIRLSDFTCAPWYSVVSIEDIFLKDRRTELIKNLALLVS